MPILIYIRGIYSCTSNGALRMTPHENDGEPSNPLVTLVPTRLCGWRLGSDQQTFAYGGDEVELSVWDTEKAFSQSPEELSEAPSAKKKRKRSDALFPAEVWRAKNVSCLCVVIIAYLLPETQSTF